MSLMRSFDLWTHASNLSSTRAPVESSLRSSRSSRPSRELKRSSIRAPNDLMRFSNLSSATSMRPRIGLKDRSWSCRVEERLDDHVGSALKQLASGRSYENGDEASSFMRGKCSSFKLFPSADHSARVLSIAYVGPQSPYPA